MSVQHQHQAKLSGFAIQEICSVQEVQSGSFSLPPLLLVQQLVKTGAARFGFAKGYCCPSSYVHWYAGSGHSLLETFAFGGHRYLAPLGPLWRARGAMGQVMPGMAAEKGARPGLVVELIELVVAVFSMWMQQPPRGMLVWHCCCWSLRKGHQRACLMYVGFSMHHLQVFVRFPCFGSLCLA
jgi:hypothetical protein